jgi:hypothetical protein
VKKLARGTSCEELVGGAGADCNNKTNPRIWIVRFAWSSKDNEGTAKPGSLDTGGGALGLEYDPITETTSSMALICVAARAQAMIPTDTEISRFGCRESGPDVSDPEV